jgi:folylpolyglutamate synthase/dihydropteroate synthase
LILGILADKDCRAICEILAPVGPRILLVRVGSERSAKPEELVPFCRAANPQANVSVCDSLGEAMELLGLSPVPCADEKALNEWTPQRKL